MRPIEVSEAISVYATANVPVMLWGQPGVGKSDVVRQLAAKTPGKFLNPLTGKKERKVFDVRLALLDPTDLRGIPYYDPEMKTARWGQSCILPMMDREEDQDAILFLDEINSAPPVIQAAAYQLVLDRKVGEYELPKGVTIIAAGNRQSDKGVVFQMPTPLLNRFAHIDFTVSNDDWIEFAVGAGIHPSIIGFINFNKDKNIRVEFIGDRSYKTTMSPTDRQAAANVYELAQILSAMQEIKKEQEAANLKIGFINKKKERKAQEEPTDK